jgi:curved DNA-binding protein CbpA
VAIDLYSLLGVSRDADDKTIRAAYRALAKQCHPDLTKGRKAQATERFYQITAAYEALRSAGSRAQYDMKRARQEESDRARREQVARTLRRAGERVGRPVKNDVGPAWQPRPGPDGRERRMSRPPERSADNITAIVRKWRHMLLPAVAIFALVIWAAGVDWLPIKMSPSKIDPVAQSAQNRIESASRPTGIFRNAVCVSEDGTAFSITNQNGSLSVSYDGAAPVRPKIEVQGALTVLSARVGSGKGVAIGLFKGDKDGTMLIFSDDAGNPVKTVGAKCSEAAL